MNTELGNEFLSVANCEYSDELDETDL